MRVSAGLVRRLLGAVLASGLLAAWLSGPGPERIEVTAEFARAGLNVRPGDEVRVRGIPVGTISAIEIDEETYRARYRLSIDPDAPVAADTGAALVPKTLFGDKYVALEGAARSAPHLEDGAFIPVARTSAPSEVQEVLDRLEPLLREVDPVTFSNVIASTAEGLDGAGPDIARLVDALPSALETISANQQDLGRIFRAVPGIAGTLEQRAAQLVEAADAFGTLAQTFGDNQEALVRFVSDTAELSRRAADLLDAEEVRLDRILAGTLSVLDLVDEQPGRIQSLLDATPTFVNGLAAATGTGAFRAPIAHFGVLNPGSLPDAKGEYSEAEGGAGIGPDVVIEGFPVDDGVTVGAPDGSSAPGGSAGGVAALLGNLLGGGRG